MNFSFFFGELFRDHFRFVISSLPVVPGVAINLASPCARATL